MGANKIHIYCQGFQWDPEIPLEEMNFFSNETKTPVTDEIDLTDFAVELGELEYTFEDTDEENGINTHFFQASSINIKLSGVMEISSGYTMKEFFKMFEDTSNIKYKVRIVHDDHGLLFQGTVNQDGLKMPVNTGNESHIIDVMVVGMEREMKDYFMNKPLPNPDEVPWYWSRYYVGGGQGGTHTYSDHVSYARFYEVVQGLLENDFITSFSFDDDILEWFVAKEGRFVISPETGSVLHHTRQGYERFTASGCTRWKWLEWVCNSMGWIYFIYKDTFYIRNRCSFNLPVAEIEFENVIEYEIGKRKPILNYDYIMFLTGAYYGGNAAVLSMGEFRGERPVMISNKQTFYRNTNHWNQASGNVGNWYSIANTNGYKFSKYRSENDNILSIYNIENNGGYSISSIPIEQSKILRIETGETANAWSRVRLDIGQDFAYENGGDILPGNFDLTYTGCAGDQLMKIVQTVIQEQNYSGRYGADGYVNSPQFANNYSKFWNNKTNIYLAIIIAETITNPLQNFKFLNSGINFFENTEWSVQSMKFNLMEEITEFELLKTN